jgi:hypothetical protein
MKEILKYLDEIIEMAEHDDIELVKLQRQMNRAVSFDGESPLVFHLKQFKKNLQNYDGKS